MIGSGAASVVFAVLMCACIIAQLPGGRTRPLERAKGRFRCHGCDMNAR